ncbi:MAG: aspartate-semialdehyde dehydrogenase [Clostridia bacterium]|nr:aspartate-semialdehyde dehydrogenase [Clostridia bacterium]
MFIIAIVGATGLVGKTALKVFEERGLTNHNCVMFAGEEDVGKIVKFGGRHYVAQELNKRKILCGHFDYALFCTKEDVSKIYVPIFSRCGTRVVDCSSYFRHKHPLIVPEINFKDAIGNIITNPNCSTAGCVVALNKINAKFGLKNVVYSSYQAVSGAGSVALKEMHLTKKENLSALPEIICNNVIPCIGKVEKNLYSTEENKMIYETKKILGDFNISVTATCVRVPITVGHTISINFTTKKYCTLNKIINLLRNSPGLTYVENGLPMPKDVRGKNNVLVGRVRKDLCLKNTFNMVVVVDNLRKGASQNAVQIIERFINEKQSF